MTVLHIVPSNRPAGEPVTAACGISDLFDDSEGVRSTHPLGEDSSTICLACRAVKTGKPVDGPLVRVELVDTSVDALHIGWRLRYHADHTVERVVTFGDMEISGAAQVAVDVAAGFLKAQKAADEAADEETYERGWAVA